MNDEDGILAITSGMLDDRDELLESLSNRLAGMSDVYLSQSLKLPVRLTLLRHDPIAQPSAMRSKLRGPVFEPHRNLVDAPFPSGNC